LTSLVAGSGHSGYGVGLALPQTRFTTVPSATFCPAPVATGATSTRWVWSGIDVISRVVLVVVPSALVCGTVSVKRIRNGEGAATAGGLVFSGSPWLCACRGR